MVMGQQSQHPGTRVPQTPESGREGRGHSGGQSAPQQSSTEYP